MVGVVDSEIDGDDDWCTVEDTGGTVNDPTGGEKLRCSQHS